MTREDSMEIAEIAISRRSEPPVPDQIQHGVDSQVTLSYDWSFEPGTRQLGTWAGQ